jgi:hypothetical protein
MVRSLLSGIYNDSESDVDVFVLGPGYSTQAFHLHETLVWLHQQRSAAQSVCCTPGTLRPEIRLHSRALTQDQAITN